MKNKQMTSDTVSRNKRVDTPSGGKMLLGMVVLFSWISAAHPNVWPIEDTWSAVGSTTLSDITGSYDNGDGTNETMMLVDGTSASGQQGVTYDFRGTLNSGEYLLVQMGLVNPNVSYCRLVIDLYNVTDNRVIATTSEITLNGNSTKAVYLSMTAGSNDSNDQLQLRFLRSDDLSTVRDFAVDSVRIDDWYFPRTSNSPITPDLPLLSHDAALQSDMDSIINTWYSENLSNPSSSSASSAVITYNSKGIVNNGGVVTGNITDYNQMSYLKTLAGALHYDNPSNTTWLNAVNNTVKLVAQNLLRGIIPLDEGGYDTRDFIRKAVFLKDHLDQAAKDSLTYVLFRSTRSFDPFWRADYPGPVSEDSISTDEVYNYADTLMLYAIGFQKNDLEAQRWARGFKRYCDRFSTPSRGTSDGIKVDGSGFHHWCNHERYMYTYRTFTDVLDSLDNTQMQIDVDKYYNFRDAVIAQFVRGRERVIPVTLSGRVPTDATIGMADNNLEQFARAGGRILGLPNADPEVAKVYNAIFGVDSSLGTTAQNSLEGAFQFNYGHMGTYRKSNWTATMRGFSDYMWGTEIYDTANRYGRYQSYGALQVIYSGGESVNGINFNGWDWNYAPGTTSIVLPFDLLHAERGRIDELQQSSFVGFGTLGNKGSELLGDLHGTYGIFGMKFREVENQGFGATYGPNTHNNTFVFRKSAFAFDDIIIALGSDIANDDTTHKTVTTLYQRTASGTVVVNGSDYTSQSVNTFSSGSSRWALDRLNTGYYIPATNDNLVLSRASQTTPAHDLNDPSNTGIYKTGIFTKLYIDHGTAPAGDDYEFVIMPGTTESTISSFASSMTGPEASRPYLVKAKDVNHHVVKYQDNGKEIWGLALFENIASLPAGCVVRSNTGRSLVMYEQNAPQQITLSVTDPDLGLASRSYAPSTPSSVELTLSGRWLLQNVNTNVTVQFSSLSNQTVLTFDLLDGMPEEVLLDSPDNNVPTFDANPLVKANATEDAAYSGSIADNASDVDGDDLAFGKVSGPSWLSVAGDGTLSGTPLLQSDGGVNNWTVLVTDGIDTNTTTLRITVDNVNDAPIFDSNPLVEIDAREDTYYSSTIADNTSDEEEDGVTFAKISGPVWLDVSTNGVLSGTPEVGDAGTNSWVVEVSDGNDATSATLNIFVNSFYPESRATDSSYEWIANVTIGSINRSSGDDGGYYDATLLSTTETKGDSVTFSLAKNVPPAEIYFYHWRIWIDLNYDGDFDDSQELVYSTPVASSNMVSGSFTLPTNYAYTGATRMRVSMKWQGDGYPNPNEIFTFGEVEDYTINIISTGNSAPVWDSDPIVEAGATKGTFYGSSIADHASDDDTDPLSFDKVSGPVWLDVSTNGVLSGTPAGIDIGPNEWIVSVTDGIATNTAQLQISVASDGDWDDDGIPDNWELDYFGHETNAVSSNDSDGDGQTDGEEYIAGFDPTNSASFFSITGFDLLEGSTNAAIDWISVDGRMYDALRANSLTGSFSTVVSNMLYPQGSCTVEVNQVESEGFFKLEVRLEP